MIRQDSCNGGMVAYDGGGRRVKKRKSCAEAFILSTVRQDSYDSSPSPTRVIVPEVRRLQGRLHVVAMCISFALSCGPSKQAICSVIRVPSRNTAAVDKRAHRVSQRTSLSFSSSSGIVTSELRSNTTPAPTPNTPIFPRMPSAIFKRAVVRISFPMRRAAQRLREERRLEKRYHEKQRICPRSRTLARRA